MPKTAGKNHRTITKNREEKRMTTDEEELHMLSSRFIGWK